MTLRSRREVLAWALSLPALACGDTSRPSTSTAAVRIASQTVLSDEVLWDLGPTTRDQVVAVSALVDDPRYSRVADRWPKALPRSPGTSEALLALAPTLVVIASFTAPETRRLLEQVGLNTLVLESFDGFSDYRANVRAIAAASGAAEAGERLVADFDRRLDSLRVDDPDGPLVISWNEGSVPAAGTTFDDAATAAGFRNLPSTEGRRGHLQLGMEQLVAWDPETIVIPCGDDDCDRVEKEFAARPGIRGTKAARRGGIIGVPSSALYSTGSSMLDVVQRLADARPEPTP